MPNSLISSISSTTAQGASKTPSPIWRPFTQMKTASPPHMVHSGNGVYLEIDDGHKIIDCISSWWTNIHGHSHPEIAKAIYEQALNLEHVIFGGFTHKPAEKFASSLLNYLPNNLSRVFYSDNGSTAVEAALKIAYQYWANNGQTQRTRFIGFDGGYHGDTIGAMSIGKSSTFGTIFKPLLFDIDIIPFPETYIGDTEYETREQQSLNQFDELLNKQADKYAAIFIEPLVQGVSGMRMCRPEFLQALQAKAKNAGVLLIYDEAMTGFGRTGDWFACTKANTTPDIVCLAKGITGGFLPLAATITTNQIFEAFYSDDAQKAFYHGHTYTGNPLACAAAAASLNLLEQNQNSFRVMEKQHYSSMDKWLISNKKIEKSRICGTIAAFDIVSEEGTYYFNNIGLSLREKFIKQGLLIRPLGNTIYLIPPYCITNEEIDFVYETISRVLQEL